MPSPSSAEAIGPDLVQARRAHTDGTVGDADIALPRLRRGDADNAPASRTSVTKDLAAVATVMTPPRETESLVAAVTLRPLVIRNPRGPYFVNQVIRLFEQYW
jgi:hypothetical protein